MTDLVKGIIDSLDHLHDGLQGVVQLELVLLALERLRQVLAGLASVYWLHCNQSSHLGIHKQTNACCSIPRSQTVFYHFKICRKWEL